MLIIAPTQRLRRAPGWSAADELGYINSSVDELAGLHLQLTVILFRYRYFSHVSRFAHQVPGKDATFVVESEKSPTAGAADATVIEFHDETGNVPLHVSLRPRANHIAINSKKHDKQWNWNKQRLISFNDNFPSSKPLQLKVTDNGLSFRLDFSEGNGVKYDKNPDLGDSKVSKVAYYVPDKGHSVLSEGAKLTVTLP
ncbi:hypothetical protein BN14_05918 [Rhizoctonia solani AG-1 IB]|uniref:Galectin n=1 Tax=Thanatephorus cucumeris (strain AG1-IB / isolate 7/3/14) TaxID=1108050 RepID=M5C7N8_THACB|nr:hypothetical protein BN14_05918 [Rhizoctonia solani AG-1 IB]